MTRTSRSSVSRKVAASREHKLRPCPVCGGEMRRGRRTDTVEYKGLWRKVTQPGWYCADCGEAVLEPADIKATEAAFFDLKAEADGLVTAEEIKRIRRSLGLSQREAGEVLGGGPRAFQKYESRAVMVSKPMSNLLRVLDRHPRAIKELSARAVSPERGKPLR